MILDYCSPLIRGKSSTHALKKVALENFKRIESRIRMSIVLKIGVSYQEHMILEEVARENFRHIESRIRMSIVLKIGGSYQKHMILGQVKRDRPPMVGVPDTCSSSNT